MKQIAFLGLGVMGSHMAANLARSSESVKAWNRTGDRPTIKIAANAGAIIVPSLAEAVKNAEIIFTCLGDVPDVEAVILGAGGVAEFAQKNALIVDTSTIGADAARKIGTELDKQNLRFLDAPISGGDIGAKNGTLTFMVGGSESDFAECKPFFEIMGKTIILCGEVGSGQAVKMCNQILCALNMVGLCEAMQLAEKQGIDPNLVVEVCSTGAAGSWALSNLGPKIIESDYQPGFAIKHIIKDLRLVLEAIANSEANLPGTKLADGLFKTVKEFDNGLGSEQGTQAMIRAYREGD
ncbi:MAG: NAD(P)-dependent oxidoreductase [Oscillatoria sp. PMC 1068.18]|nr:NAD(P)-dependent oxidoreductase [Oscillatoria sp. PMC 1076.18]MEC4991790.1 NAD(P)-dependent oxidoreductase [Oscillatoria sp. PMC 1068.18]